MYSLYIHEKVSEKRKKIDNRDDLDEDKKLKKFKKIGCLYIFIGFVLFFILMIIRSRVFS